MKLFSVRSFVLFFFLLFVCSGPALAGDNPWEKKLPFQSATISYAITGMETGTETLYIKDYGRYRALHHEGTGRMLGITTTSRRIELTDPDWHYSFDLEEQTGTKTINPARIYQEEYNRLTPAEQENVRKNAEEFGMSMVKGFQGEIVPRATTILGYECDRTTMMGTTVSLIHNTDIPLLSEFNLMGMKGKTAATAIDTTPPPETAFAPPAGITPVHDPEADEAARLMIADIISNLKEPDGAENFGARLSGEVGGDEEQSSPVFPDRESVPDEGAPAEQQPANLDQTMQQGMEMIKGLFGR